MSRLIESVTIHLCEDGSAEAEVVATVSDLMAFAANKNTRRPYGADGYSISVVAGTGFEPVTFRL